MTICLLWFNAKSTCSSLHYHLSSLLLYLLIALFPKPFINCSQPEKSTISRHLFLNSSAQLSLGQAAEICANHFTREGKSKVQGRLWGNESTCPLSTLTLYSESLRALESWIVWQLTLRRLLLLRLSFELLVIQGFTKTFLSWLLQTRLTTLNAAMHLFPGSAQTRYQPTRHLCSFHCCCLLVNLLPSVHICNALLYIVY